MQRVSIWGTQTDTAHIGFSFTKIGRNEKGFCIHPRAPLARPIFARALDARLPLGHARLCTVVRAHLRNMGERPPVTPREFLDAIYCPSPVARSDMRHGIFLAKAKKNLHNSIF